MIFKRIFFTQESANWKKDVTGYYNDVGESGKTPL